MSVTSGFFNSINSDRRYNAEQMSEIFNGIINDGIFMNVGKAFKVTASTGNVVNVETGRAWFNGRWLNNDTIHPVTLDASDFLLDRIDAVVFDINSEESVREGSIKAITGTPSSSPERPKMVHTEMHNQYPLCYILRKAGESVISQSNLTSMLGTEECPYVTGILDVVSIDSVVAQWHSQWADWFDKETNESNNAIDGWLSDKQIEFNEWFGNLQDILDGDAASKIAKRLTELESKFATLVKEHCIYESVESSSGDPVIDSYNTAVLGKIAYELK